MHKQKLKELLLSKLWKERNVKDWAKEKKGRRLVFHYIFISKPKVKEMKGEENSYILHTMLRLKFNGMSMRVTWDCKVAN